MADEIKREVDLITGAHIAAEDLRREREKYEAVLKRMESFESRQILGGKTSAGEPQVKEISEDEKIKEEAKRYFKGGMLEKVFE